MTSDHGESLKSRISYIFKHVVYQIKLLLLLFMVETSVHVVPYVQISGSFLKPKWIKSLCLYCVRYCMFVFLALQPIVVIFLQPGSEL